MLVLYLWTPGAPWSLPAVCQLRHMPLGKRQRMISIQCWFVPATSLSRQSPNPSPSPPRCNLVHSDLQDLTQQSTIWHGVPFSRGQWILPLCHTNIFYSARLRWSLGRIHTSLQYLNMSKWLHFPIDCAGSYARVSMILCATSSAEATGILAWLDPGPKIQSFDSFRQ